jgi:hypothetical protein
MTSGGARFMSIDRTMHPNITQIVQRRSSIEPSLEGAFRVESGTAIGGWLLLDLNQIILSDQISRREITR